MAAGLQAYCRLQQAAADATRDLDTIGARVRARNLRTASAPASIIITGVASSDIAMVIVVVGRGLPAKILTHAAAPFARVDGLLLSAGVEG